MVDKATKKILVIDNEQYIREVTQICLETMAGWQVLAASSGREGLIKAETEQPDAILLDIAMPDLDGLDTFQKLQANPKTQKIPVILLTARVRDADRHCYAELGITAAIAKPFNPLELASSVARHLGWVPIE